MNILVAGRLGVPAERVAALREYGNELVYCGMPAPAQKPIPDDLGDQAIPRYMVDREDAVRQIRRIADRHAIDVVYSLKNVWDGSMELTDALIEADVAPVVRHYKEHFCQPSGIERRTLTETAAQIYVNEESFQYFRKVYGVREDTAHVLDPDYLPATYMGDCGGELLCESDGEPHLLLAGGVSVTGGRNDVRRLSEELSARGIHLHIYGRKYVGPDERGVWGVGHPAAREAYERLAVGPYVHLHDHIGPEGFSREWSRYDAGLMHVTSVASHDVPFQPLNYPKRISSYFAAGLPLAQESGSQAAMERFVRTTGTGFTFADCDELDRTLRDRALMAELRTRVAAKRHAFTFEAIAGELNAVLSAYAR